MIPLGLDDQNAREYAFRARVKERKAMIVDDMTVDPRITLPKKRRSNGLSLRSPYALVVSDEPIGLLALYADTPGFFNEEDEKCGCCSSSPATLLSR